MGDDHTSAVLAAVDNPAAVKRIYLIANAEEHRYPWPWLHWEERSCNLQELVGGRRCDDDTQLQTPRKAYRCVGEEGMPCDGDAVLQMRS